MQRTTNESVLRIGKGAGLLFIGSFISILFAFLGRVLLARMWSVDDYGIFSQAFAVLNIAVVIAMLGLQQGSSRSVAYAMAKDRTERVRDIVTASTWLTLAAGIIMGAILFLASDFISSGILDEPALKTPLKIFAVAIPFFTLTNVLAAVFLGFGHTQAKIYFQDIMRNTLFLVFLLAVLFLNVSFTGVFYAYMISLVISCLLLIIYTRRRLPSSVQPAIRVSGSPVIKELLIFSIPLLGIAVVDLAMGLADTLILGYFRTSMEVGLYNAAQPLCILLSAPATSLALIYLPVTSDLFARGLLAEIRGIYSILTKWLCFVTIPLFLILLFFPETVIALVFGAGYTGASMALRILAFGFIINNLVGPNGAALIAMGRPQFVMWANLSAMVLNIVLNITLIPLLGIVGAATAFAASMAFLNLIKVWRLYSLYQIQPWTKNLAKPVPVFFVIVLAVYFISIQININSWFYVPIFLLYYAVCGLAIIVTRSIAQEDIDILAEIEKRLPIKTEPLKRFLRRFL